MQGSCRRLLRFVFFFLLLSQPGFALAYSNIISFGDSLSDSGNIVLPDGTAVEFSDGPVWVELLASHYSATLYNQAFGGATTAYDNPAGAEKNPALLPTGLRSQVEWMIPALGLFPLDETLVTVWAGANDLLQDGATRTPDLAVGNIIAALDSLYAADVRNFLVPNLPDIGLTPAILSGDPNESAQASLWAFAYNMFLDMELQAFAANHIDVNLFFVDSFTIFNGYEPWTEAWLDLFWIEDGFHPSALGHKLIFEAAWSSLAPAPEPTTMLLFGTGLAGLAGIGRRRKK